MIYRFYPGCHEHHLRSDLVARQLALASGADRVLTKGDRVVYRRVPDPVKGLHTAKKPMPDFIDWLEGKRT